MATVKNKNERDCRIIANGNTQSGSLAFNKIKVGNKTLSNDVVLDIGQVITDKYSRRKKYTKEDVLKAIEQNNMNEQRKISNYFFKTSGIYSRLCRYMAFLFKYDWFITPMIYDEKLKQDGKSKKVVEGWYKSTRYLENCNLKKVFGEIALKVVRTGAYYGVIVQQKDACFIQELPISYCRSRYQLNGNPAVEFNMKYFDDAFSDTAYRLRVLKLWPKEVQKAYLAYKDGKLPIDYAGDTNGWFLLDPSTTVKFNITGGDAPLFMSIIPKLLDLEDAQDLDKKKMLQQILKIIIQKMPIDKNGDLIFDVQEAQQLHTNAVAMLGDAVGVDVLTTFADVDVADLSDKGNVSSVDQLNKVERSVYNEAGTGQNLFNADGNLALEKSIANDEATMSDLILQFQTFAEHLLAPFNKNSKRLYYHVDILPTTVYNYKDLSKQYKDMTSLGFSKLLPQIALGQSQSAVLMTAYFENDIMSLNEVFVAPALSSTMSNNGNGNTTAKTKQQQTPSSGNKGGRPEKPDSEKSDKTIANIEAEG